MKTKLYFIILLTFLILTSCSTNKNKNSNEKVEWPEAWFIIKGTDDYNFRLNLTVYKKNHANNEKNEIITFSKSDIKPESAKHEKSHYDKGLKEFIEFEVSEMELICKLNIIRNYADNIVTKETKYKNLKSSLVKLECVHREDKLFFNTALCHYVDNNEVKVELFSWTGAINHQTVGIKDKKSNTSLMIHYGCAYEIITD